MARRRLALGAGGAGRARRGAASRRPPRGPARARGLGARCRNGRSTRPSPPPGNLAVEPAEARRRLAALLGAGAEARPQQADYASAVSAAFAPRERQGEPNFVLAEAGTGVGKTLGYIAPASLWAEKNGGAGLDLTYTRNLQRQIDGELDRLYPDPVRKSAARRWSARAARTTSAC